MPGSQHIAIAVASATTRAELESSLRAVDAKFSIVDEGTAGVEAILARSPGIVLMDVGALNRLPQKERHMLRQSGAELVLAYHPAHTGPLLKGDEAEISDFIELPVEAERLRAQLARAFDISHLRGELASARERAERDARAFDALLTTRTHERNEAENRAAKLSTRLADFERLKSNLITIISHEFKTPLHLASGYVNLLGDGSVGPLNDEQNNAVDVIRRQLTRLTHKLQDIERIAQLETGIRADLREAVDVAEVVRQELEGFEEAFHEKRLVHHFEAGRDVPSIQGCQDFLSDVFRRLIDNAVHYTTAGGKVRVEVLRQEDAKGRLGVLVRVTDSGRGIPKALLPHLFERFGEFRDIEHHSSRRSGLGLGLAICRHLVEMHEGEIGVTSEEGKGSTFAVFLPAAAGGGPEEGTVKARK